MLYLIYNHLLTSMLLANEIFSFAVGNKGKYLRAAFPVAKQRSAYYQQVPWRYSIPLLIAMGLLHYFISQSLFVQVTDLYEINGNFWPGSTMITPGFSNPAILAGIIWSFVMLVALYDLALRRFDGRNMPLLGSNSLAISAACHPPINDINAATRKIAYGVLPGDGDRVGFTSLKVGELQEGVVYH